MISIVFGERIRKATTKLKAVGEILTVVVAEEEETRYGMFGEVVPVSSAVVVRVQHALLSDEPVVRGDRHGDDDQGQRGGEWCHYPQTSDGSFPTPRHPHHHSPIPQPSL